MVAPTPIDWNAIEDGIHAWFSGATGLTTIWENQSAPQPDFPYASLQVTSGPTRVGGADEHRYNTDYPVYVFDVDITPIAQSNVTYEVQINGTSFQYISDFDATVAEITAGLTSAINAGSEPVTATDNTTHLSVVSDTTALFTLTLADGYDNKQLSYANNDTGHEVGIEVVGLREITVSCQVFIDKPDSIDPTKHALHFMSIAQSSLGLPSYLAALSTAGLAVIDEGTILDIAEIVGDAYISRTSMDVRFYLASSVTERIGYIETAKISSPDLGIIDESFGGS